MRIPALKFVPLAAIGGALALVIGLFAAQAGGASASAIAIDLDTAGNTATILGATEECLQVTAGDTITFDVVIKDIPVSNPMIGFVFTLGFNASHFSITAVDGSLLLNATAGSSIVLAGDETSLPVTDGTFSAAAADTGVGTTESGSGVLERLTMTVDAATPAGGYTLDLTDSAHTDSLGDQYAPAELNGARLAVGVTCDSLGTATPVITPTPAPSEKWANVDCGAAGVGIEDAQRIAKFLANKTAPTPDNCYDIGASVTVNGTPQEWANVDCGAAGVGIEDAQRIAKFLANKTAPTPAGCFDIGAPITVFAN